MDGPITVCNHPFTSTITSLPGNYSLEKHPIIAESKKASHQIICLFSCSRNHPTPCISPPSSCTPLRIKLKHLRPSPSPSHLICPVDRFHTTCATLVSAKLTTPHSQRLKRLDRCAASATDATVGRRTVELGRGLVGTLAMDGPWMGADGYKKRCHRCCGALNLLEYLVPSLYFLIFCSLLSTLPGSYVVCRHYLVGNIYFLLLPLPPRTTPYNTTQIGLLSRYIVLCAAVLTTTPNTYLYTFPSLDLQS